MKTIKSNQLRVGDVVKMSNALDAAYMDMTVTRVDRVNKMVYVFRPYVHLSNLICSSGATPYIGFEQMTFGFESATQFVLLDNIYRGE